MAKLESKSRNYDCSYLPEDNCPSYVTFKNEIVALMEKYFENSNISRNINENSDTSHEDVVDRIYLFGEFMKCMQLLDILHTSWNGYDPGHVTAVFRPRDSPIKEKIIRLITNDDGSRNQVHWSFQVLLRNW